MSKTPSGPPDNRGPKSPSQQQVELERMKFTMEQLPDTSYPINPPPVMDPKVIVIPHETAPTVLGRYLLAADGDLLAIVDTQYGQVCAHSIEVCRAQVEELIRLANRPEPENRT
jgi:hypothetical protein